MSSYSNIKQEMQKGKRMLLECKDSQIRISALQQCEDSIDKGIHIGGAFSAIIPLVTLFYGGYIHLNVTDPTSKGQDIFVLSKGHSVAAMASIYADKGYFPMELLKNSRSFDSILNGHPGPVLPGVHVSTGPLGQGLSVATGFAQIGKECLEYDVYCMAGDGEMQEGSIWEAVMYAGEHHLSNICMIIDRNNGQLDCTQNLLLSLSDLKAKFESFGWRVMDIDGTSYQASCGALSEFKDSPRDGRPTLIISNTTKGFGGFTAATDSHKANITGELFRLEMAQQQKRFDKRIQEVVGFLKELYDENKDTLNELLKLAGDMNVEFSLDAAKQQYIFALVGPKERTKRVPPRCKKMNYSKEKLPLLDKSKEYVASKIVTDTMKVIAEDDRVVSIDCDLSSTSGLQEGVRYIDKTRALNVGIAESNMMCMGEAYAASGYNAWVSAFCPFFEWRAMRRIAVGYQERLESIKAKSGWLSEGHGLDLTFLATAPNLETQTNGATHMGNDDISVFAGIAHLKIIDTSCPQQLLSIMKWIAEGNKGLIYLRIMRSKSTVLYTCDYEFEYGKGYYIARNEDSRIVIISSGRGVHEALTASENLKLESVSIDVIDMPSIDEKLLVSLAESGKKLIFAEQNNGYIFSAFQKAMFKYKIFIDMKNVISINALDDEWNPRFIHSGTYSQLVESLRLRSDQLVESIKNMVI